MRRQDQLDPIGRQLLTRSKIPCVSECVCNYHGFDIGKACRSVKESPDSCLKPPTSVLGLGLLLLQA